jgi:hypothetical protein
VVAKENVISPVSVSRPKVSGTGRCPELALDQVEQTIFGV